MRPPIGVVLGFVLLFTLVPPAQTAQPVFRLTTDLGIPANAQTDVSDALTQAIAALPPGVVLLLQGVYRIDHTVVIQGKSGLQIECPPSLPPSGCGFMRPQQALRPLNWPHAQPWFPYLYIQHSTGITLKNFGIRGPLTQPVYDKTREFAHGITAANGAKDILIRNLTITGVHGDFVHLAGGQPLGDLETVATNVTVDGLVGRVAGRQGFGLVAFHNAVFRNFDIRLIGRSGADIEPLWMMPDGIVDGLLMEDGQIRDYRNFGFGAHPQVAAYNVIVRRVAFSGGLGLGKFPMGESPNRTLIIEDVTYDWHSLAVPITKNLGSWTSSGVGVTIIRANWRFNSENPSMASGQGEVRDSVFINDHGVFPAMCIGPGVSDVNNQGTGTCDSTVTRK